MAKIIKNQGNKGFTTMLNDHFHDKRLSWGAVGLLSNVFSLPDDWEFSVRGFQTMHSDGERAVSSIIYELEWFGYLERIQVKDTNGKFVDYIYEFFNESQAPDKLDPVPAWKDRKQFAIKRTQIVDADTGEIVSNSTTERPYLQNADTAENQGQKPYLQNADTENADTVFAGQLNTNKLITNELRTNQSINHREQSSQSEKVTPTKKTIDRLIDTDTINDIKDQIQYDILLQDYNRDTLDTAVSCIAELYTATEPMTFNSRTYSAEKVHRRSLEIDAEHIRYVFDCFQEQREKVYNVKKYLMTAIFNAPDTMGAYYENAVRAVGLI